MATIPQDERSWAEQRVHRRFERQRTKLFKACQARRSALVREHQQKLGRLDDQRERLHDRKQETLKAHERAWERERERLSHKTTRVPGFGLLGPPQRNLQREYNERRERWEQQREKIKEDFDEKLRFVGQQRHTLSEQHSVRLLSHERWDRLAQGDLARRQDKSLESAVAREMTRAERSVTRSFTRKAREFDRER